MSEDDKVKSPLSPDEDTGLERLLGYLLGKAHKQTETG